jgi:hypothetical protein
MLPALGGLSLFAPLLSGLLWAALLIFRGFPIFIKFLIEWELLSLLISNFHGFGVAFFLQSQCLGYWGFLAFGLVFYMAILLILSIRRIY